MQQAGVEIRQFALPLWLLWRDTRWKTRGE
jgi:hypothetical protein